MESMLSPDPLVDGANLPEQWKRFKRDFELFLMACEKDNANDAVKVALLLRTIGPRGNDIYASFTWEQEDHRVVYAKVVEKFGEFCAPRINTVAMTHKLLTTKQGRLSIDEYVTELHNIARDCNFGEMYDRMVLQALILGVESSRTQRRMFEDQNLTLATALNICRGQEAATRDLRSIDSNKSGLEEVKAVQPRGSFKRPDAGKRESPARCGKCDRSHPPRSCPAYGKECRKCKKSNHFERCCPFKRGKADLKKGETTHQTSEWNYSTDSDEYSNSIKVTNRDRKLLTELNMQAGKAVCKVEFQLDTGATCNILSTKDYYRLKCPPLQKTSTKITCYNGTDSNPLGWCYLTTNDENARSLKLKFLVIDVTHQYSLLSMSTCLDMGLLSVSEVVHLTQADDLEPLLSEYEDVFTGLGELPGEYKIELNKDCRSVQVRPRKIPLTMKSEVMAELKRLEEEGIITKVTRPTEWISHMQPVRKANGTVRICIDPQNLNRAVKRNHTVMPTLDDVLPQLNAAKYFSLCDARSGFLQVKLHESSTELTTFWTPNGRYKYLRLPFGLSSAPEEFQRRLADALQGLHGVTVVADDILVFGKDREEHDKHLCKLLERARTVGLRLNKEKCRFLEPELPYIGHLLTQDGVKPDPNKVAAILEMSPPTKVEGVKRFLGHVTYMSKFIPNLSAETEPLRRVLQCRAFVWEEDQARAFQKLKLMLTEAKTLQYYDVNKAVVVQTDASTAGLGATLLQGNRPVTYVSRSLTECESHYAPIELETLAIVYALSRLDQYVFGHKDVTVVTDHKPLMPIFKKPIFKASRRIQSMLLSLQRYSGIKVIWRPGSEQVIADLLSRDSHMEAPTIPSPREHVFEALETSTDRPMPDPVYEDIRRKTKLDADLQTLIEHIELGGTSALPSKLQVYDSFKDELTIEGGIIFRGLRAVIPLSFQSDMLNRLHAGHQGVNSSLRRARQAVYWPGMTEDITKKCQSCPTCLKDAPKQRKEELRSHHIPTKPWSKVGVDLFEYAREHYVVIVDYTSDYFEFVKIRSQAAKDVIGAMKEVFARLGIPNLVQSDNASYFVSAEFGCFSQGWGFAHSTSSPHYHQSNGKVESVVKISKRLLRRCADPYMALLEYRNTPTEGTTTSPIQRLLGKSTRTIIPQRLVSSVEEADNRKQKLTKQLRREAGYNRTALNLPELREGQPVMVRDYHTHKRRWKEARVVKQLSGRSYSIEVDGELLRRNRRDLKPTNSEDTLEQAASSPTPLDSSDVLAAPNPAHTDHAPVPVVGSVPVRSSGRIRREPV